MAILQGLGSSSVTELWKYAQNVTDEQMAQQAQQALQAQHAHQNQYEHLYQRMQNQPQMVYDPTTETIRPVVNPHYRARELFLMRMGGVRKEFKLSHLDFLQCHIENETVHLFYCFGSKTGVASEQIDGFPSDQLIAQFRMVLA